MKSKICSWRVYTYYIYNLRHFSSVCLRKADASKSWSSSSPLSFNRTRKLSQYSGTIMSTHCKDFCFDNYDVVGFDLDGTLARFNLNEMVPLVYKLLSRYLIERKGYPCGTLEEPLDCDFLQKGLIIDAERGNLLKIAADATILRASHGTKLLTLAEIIETYGSKGWDVSRQFVEDPLSAWNGPLAEKIRTLLDFFDLPASLVFARAVDTIDATCEATGTERPKYYKVWPDLLEALVEMYQRDNFANGRSAYFTALRSDPERYIRPTKETVTQWLMQLRARGKALFLLTGSNADFANLTATFALGKEWQQLFDCVVCFAKKPGFFTGQRRYVRVEAFAEVSGGEIDLTHCLNLNTIYSQGNWPQLKATLANMLGKHPKQLRTVYVGDNLIQDIYTPVKYTDIDAVAISEELLEDQPSNEIVTSSFWNSYFLVNNEPTLWSGIVEQYAHICVPLMETIAALPVTHKYNCKHPGGYYPKSPPWLVL